MYRPLNFQIFAILTSEHGVPCSFVILDLVLFFRKHAKLRMAYFLFSYHL